MGFTVKYRTFEDVYEPATPSQLVQFEADCSKAAMEGTNPPEMPIGRHIGMTECDRIDGPYESIATRYEDGYLTVYASRNYLQPGMTYGPVIGPELPPGTPQGPRPTLWVMNEAGATIAKYDL